MKCLYPNILIDTGNLTDNGKRDLFFVGSELTFQLSPFYNSVPDDRIIKAPCGQCVNCRLNYARQWSVRVVAESLQYEHNYFITLTYDDNHCDFSLHKEQLRKFMKDLREYYRIHFNHTGIRFFASGEYGDVTFRPHYHLCIMNLPIPDLVHYKYNNLGMALFNSDLINNIWAQSEFTVIGELNGLTAGYTARYVMKKQTGKQSDIYKKLGIEPEFSLMSNRPGIGFNYLVDNYQTIFKYDEVVLPETKIHTIPRYFKVKAEDFDKDLVINSNDRIKAAAELYNTNVINSIELDPVEYDFLHDESLKNSLKLLTKNTI